MLKKYKIIYADPPWSFNFQKRKGLSDKAKSNLYPTMKPQDIINLPVCAIADDNAVLFVKLCGDVSRVELFCRYPADGWDVWGNEVDCTAILPE